MNEQQHDKSTPKTYLITAENHLDYVQSGIETKLPEHDGNGVLGVLELGGTAYKDNRGFVDESGSRMILVDVDSARFGPLAEFVGQFNEQTTPEGSIAAIDVRSLESPEGIDGFTNGVMLLKPSDEPHILGRRVAENRDVFKWDEYTAPGISSKHLDIRVGEDGVFVRDRGSLTRTVLGTGKYAEKMIRNTPEHHEHVIRIKELLGIEAVENTVEFDDGKEAAKFDENELSSHKIIDGILNGNGMVSDKLRELGSSPVEIQRALAYGDGSNEEVRMGIVSALGVKMRQLMNEGGHFHERVQDNRENNLKKINEGPYKDKQLRSEDYVILLALAKLDGSFIVDKNRNTGVDENDQHAGQHRQAADALLASLTGEAKEPTPEVSEVENESVNRYLSNLKLRFEAMTQASHNERSLQDVTNLLNSTVMELQQQFTDSDGIRRTAIELFGSHGNGALDQLMTKLSAEISHSNALQESSAADMSDQERHTIEQIAENVRRMVNSLDAVRRGNREMFTLQRTIREHDENIIMTAQAHARRGDYDQDIAALQNIARTMSDYANGNFTSY